MGWYGEFSNLPLVRRSCRVLPFPPISMYGRGGCTLEINLPLQQIYANSNGGLRNEGGIMLSEYGTVTFIL